MAGLAVGTNSVEVKNMKLNKQKKYNLQVSKKDIKSNSNNDYQNIQSYENFDELLEMEEGKNLAEDLPTNNKTSLLDDISSKKKKVNPFEQNDTEESSEDKMNIVDLLPDSVGDAVVGGVEKVTPVDLTSKEEEKLVEQINEEMVEEGSSAVKSAAKSATSEVLTVVLEKTPVPTVVGAMVGKSAVSFLLKGTTVSNFGTTAGQFGYELTTTAWKKGVVKLAEKNALKNIEEEIRKKAVNYALKNGIDTGIYESANVMETSLKELLLKDKGYQVAKLLESSKLTGGVITFGLLSVTSFLTGALSGDHKSFGEAIQAGVDNMADELGENVASATGAFVGEIVGAVVGTAIGGPLATKVGGIVGSILGSLIGSVGYNIYTAVSETWDNSNKNPANPNVQKREKIIQQKQKNIKDPAMAQ